MADIEEDFLSRNQKVKAAFKAPPFIPRRVLKDLGTEKITGDRYFSHEFMQQEWEKVWKKTWHFVMKAFITKCQVFFQTFSHSCCINSWEK